MKHNESAEMYLETIYLLQKNKPTVRAVDVAEELNYARSSVFRGINLLVQKGFVVIDNNKCIHLTEEGITKAKDIFERHSIISKAFILLGADQKSAEDNACRVEHVISDDIFALIKAHVTKLQK